VEATMAGSGGRTNFVKVENIPPGFSNGAEICSHFGAAGNVQVFSSMVVGSSIFVL
jgi:hypothetical protein